MLNEFEAQHEAHIVSILQVDRGVVHYNETLWPKCGGKRVNGSSWIVWYTLQYLICWAAYLASPGPI